MATRIITIGPKTIEVDCGEQYLPGLLTEWMIELMPGVEHMCGEPVTFAFHDRIQTDRGFAWEIEVTGSRDDLATIGLFVFIGGLEA